MSPKTNIAQIPDGPFLEMVSGGPKGQVYGLSDDRVSVGRSDDNHIVAASEAVSRYHAFFEKDENGGWLVRDNQSKNGVQVNGKTVDGCPLSHGDIVQVGNFVFRFHDPAVNPGEAPMIGAELGPGVMSEDMGAPAGKSRRPNKRVLIYGVVACLLAFLYMSSQEDTKPVEKTEGDKTTQAKPLPKDFRLSPEADLKNDADKNKIAGLEDPVLNRAEQEMSKLDWANSSLQKAEQFFKRGQREYLARNFTRSIDSLQTAISLSRGHELANEYLRLAVYEAEQEAKKHMDMAVQYFEALQYQRAIYHFTEVIALMAHRPSEQVVADSEKYIAICKKRLQAAELFP